MCIDTCRDTKPAHTHAHTPHTYAHTHAHTPHTYAHTHAHTPDTYAHSHTHASYICTHSRTHARTHARTRTCTGLALRMHVSIHMSLHMSTHMCIESGLLLLAACRFVPRQGRNSGVSSGAEATSKESHPKKSRRRDMRCLTVANSVAISFAP